MEKYILSKLLKLIIKNKNANICLGTDSYASNTQLSILEEIKTIRKSFGTMTTADLIKWATLNGAKALGIHNKFGSFDNGKKPGILHL